MTPPAITETQTRPPAAPAAAPVAADLPLGTVTADQQSLQERIILAVFIAVPFLAILLAIPFAWGGWLGPVDVAIAVAMYAISGHGVTVGFHRHFTHRSFKANRGVKIGLAIAGSLAIEGPVIRWVADHRKHHKYSDKDGDPHSPWRYGESIPALMKGLFYAHMGWLFDVEQTSQRQYAPDLLRDRDIVRVSRSFLALVAVSLFLPALIGGLWSWSWQGAVTAFFWASLVRIALLHHTTWSINSVCHIVGERPFRSNDKAANFWPLAILSFGESWHNLHHADPTCARHGVLRGQIDISARTIWIFEKVGWAHDVRWPNADRLAGKRTKQPV